MHKICAAVRHPGPALRRVNTYPMEHRKPLIQNAFVECLFSEQFNQGVDFQGPWRCGTQLSTKLSTEALDMLVRPLTSST
jgi:hypothetical protein